MVKVFMFMVTTPILVALFAIWLFACALTSCTYSITMVHTQGSATDVVDETQSNEPDVKADIKLPGTI